MASPGTSRPNFLEGINIDYSKVQATGASVRAILAAGKQVHVTHPNGTDGLAYSSVSLSSRLLYNRSNGTGCR